MAQFNRFNAVREPASALLFAALLIVCSITVGCSKDNPQPTSTNVLPATQPTSTLSSSAPPALPTPQPATPAPKKVARKRPATVTYTDKTYGVSFQYPRKYALETGDAANELIATGSVPMNFVQPGGMAIAAVELPDTSYPGTDFESGLFNVSIHRSLTENQCGAFSEPQSDAKTSGTPAQAPLSKLMLGDLEMQSVENIAGEGSKQNDAKYFHVFQNGACYEFALKVATNRSENENSGGKHVDRDQVFKKLEKILATVKITPTATPEVAASTPKEPVKEPTTPETPAQ
jgi:hypothetical protein